MSFNPGTGLYGGGLTNGFGNLTGNVTGNLVGNVVGNLTGDVVGDVVGNLTGVATGNVKPSDSVTTLSDVTDAGSGQIITTTERNQITANTADIATNNTHISNLNTTATTNSSNITDLQNNQIILQTTVAAHATNLTTNNTHISNLNTTATTNSSNITALQNNQLILQTTVASNTADIATNNTHISNLNTTATTNSSNITDLQGRTQNLSLNGSAFVGDGTNSGSITFNCQNNSHGVKIQAPPHSAAATYTLTLPTSDGTSGQVLQTDGNGVLSWVTPSTGGGGGLSSIILNSAVSLNIGTASSNVQFRVNEAPLGQNITLTPTATDLTFNPTSVTLNDSNQTSGNFTITATSGIGTTPPISVAIGNPATNTQTTPIIVDQTYGPAITIAGAPPYPAHYLRWYVSNSTLTVNNPNFHTFTFPGSPSITAPYLEAVGGSNQGLYSNFFRVTQGGAVTNTNPSGSAIYEPQGGFLYSGYIPPASVLIQTGKFTWAMKAKYPVTSSTNQASGSKYAPRSEALVLGISPVSPHWQGTTFPTVYPGNIISIVLNDSGNIGLFFSKGTGGTWLPHQYASPTHNVNDGLFHWYALVKDGTNYTLYVDGVSKQTYQYNQDMSVMANGVTPDNMLLVGGGYYDHIAVDCDVMEARVWEHTALTATELQGLP